MSTLKYLCFSVLTISLVACSKQSGTSFEYYRPDAADTISVTSSYPVDLDQDIPLDAQIHVKFSGSIRTQSADYISFQVVNEMGTAEQGDFQFSPANNEIIWSRKINGLVVSLDSETTYRVMVRFLEDSNGNIVPPYIFEFRTKGYSNSSGRFKVQYIGGTNPHSVEPGKNSKSTTISPGDPIYVQFSEAISPNQSGCSRTQFSTSLQILDMAILTQSGQGSIAGIPGTTCVLCRSIANAQVCDVLRFEPDQSLQVGSGLRVEVRASDFLRGVSGETLSSTESKQFFVFYKLGFDL